MIVRILVLVIAFLQIPAAAYLSIGSFEMAASAYPTLIQPASWAFSIWGLIYTLSLIYAVYQVIPKYDNQLLRSTRVPALIAFIGSSTWLYFAGATDWTVWLTIPILAIMAISLNYMVTLPQLPATWPQLFSHTILFPYAAWTGIATWLNIQSLLNTYELIPSAAINVASNVFFLICIVAWTWYFFQRSGYSIWYGGVLVWANIAIVAANVADGNLLIATMSGAFGLAALLFITKHT